MDRQLISKEDTLLWLSTGDLKGETESDKIAMQDQVLQTKCHMTKILQIETDSKCRLCQFNENSTHHISMPNIALQEQYVKDMIECVLNYTLIYTRKWGMIRQRTLV